MTLPFFLDCGNWINKGVRKPWVKLSGARGCGQSFYADVHGYGRFKMGLLYPRRNILKHQK
jgi:hypothetical protein